MPKNESPWVARLNQLVLSRWFNWLAVLVMTALSVYALWKKEPYYIFTYGLYLLSQLFMIATFFFRRQAISVDARPWVMAISFARMVWPIVVFYLPRRNTQQLIPMPVAEVVATMLFLFLLYARVSLGRNIGVLPAKRKLVTTGAYGIVRHPIQGIEVLFFWKFLLLRFSLINLLLVATGTALYYVKSQVEEDFFVDDPEYQAYKARVKWKFIPFIF